MCAVVNAGLDSRRDCGLIRVCLKGGTRVSELSHRCDLPGQVAQSVEQGTENPRVGGSIPSLATIVFNTLSPKN